MIIRTMEHMDITDCIEIGKRLHAESEYNCLAFDEQKSVEMFKYMLGDSGHIIFVAEDDSGIFGMIGCECSAPFFSSEAFAAEHFIYVTPEKRCGTAFYRLFERFYHWASTKKVKSVYLMHSTGINTDVVEKVYDRLGFSRVGSIFRRFM